MWTSSAILYISLFWHRQTHTIIFIFFSCTNVYFYIVRSMFPFLLSWSLSKASVVNLMRHLFFWSSKLFFCSFQLFENSHIHNVVSTLINVIKLYVENNSIVSALSNVFNFNVEIDNVDLTLFNVANFKTGIHNVVSTLILHCPTSRYHTTLKKTLSPCWKVSWVLPNVARRLHNFVTFFKLKTYIFSRIPLNCCSRKLSKRYW